MSTQQPSSSLSSRSLIVKVAIALVAVVAVIVVGRLIIDATTRGDVYYTQVPADAEVELGEIFAEDGEVVGTGYTYALVGYDEEGNENFLEFEVTTENPDELFYPGTFLKVDATSDTVLGGEEIDEADVPEKALERILAGEE